MNERAWRDAAVWGATLGLILLWGVACRSEIGLVQVADAHRTKDGDLVRVQGVVARYPALDVVTERLTFWLEDDTGSLLVLLEQGESRALLDRGQAPTIGDRVSVSGTVGVRKTKVLGEMILLTVGDLEDLEIERPAPVESSIADAAASDLHRKVLVRGQVSAVSQPYEGLTLLRVQDGTGEIDVVYDQDLVWLSGVPTMVLPGDWVSVQGVVAGQQGQAQIVLDGASGLRRLPGLVSTAGAASPTVVQPVGAPSSPTAISTVVSVRPTAVPRMTVQSPTSVVLATPSVSVTPAPAVVRSDSEGQGLTAAEPDLVQTGQLSEVLVGSSVTIEGRIEQATLLSAGCKWVVDDGSGPAIVWMPNALYGQAVDPEGWNVGGLVRVTGRVSEYQGELEVVPQIPGTMVTVQRSLPTAEADAQTGHLGAVDMGRRVTVEATIVSVTPFSAGVRCVLDDGSGSIVLLLWQNVFEALSDKDALAVGGHVRTSGWVQEYRGKLEIVPGLPYDVVVLP